MRIVSYNILDGGVGRADPLAEVIEAQRADVVALIEADDAAVIDRIAGRLKMDVIVAAGKSHSVALLSRFTIAESINHGALRGGKVDCFLEVKLEAGDRNWTVGVNGGSAESVVVDLFADRRKKGSEHLIVGQFDAGLAGYVDTFVSLNPDKKQAATYPTRHPDSRPDRIYVYGVAPERIVKAWIETDRLAKYASDHYPVGLEVR